MAFRKRRSFLLVSFLSVLLFPQSVFTQSRVNSIGNGGMHAIQGRIYFPNGKAPESSITVRLESTNYGTTSVETDQNGGFAFRALTPGNYTIVVNAGDYFETARENVMIDTEVNATVRRAASPKTVTLPIYLQWRRTERTKTGVINAKWSKVPEDAMELYEDGLRLLREGKTDAAATKFNAALAIDQTFSGPHIELGKMGLHSGNAETAAAAFRRALTLDPQNFDAKLGLGIALLNVRNFLDAERELSGAVELNRTAVTPHYYLGILFVQKHDLDGAQKEMEAAKNLKGEKLFPMVHRYLGGIYMAKRMNEQAVAELETYIRLVPGAKDVGRIKKTIDELRTRQN
jgi:Tfp pilus assembly protein PilF